MIALTNINYRKHHDFIPCLCGYPSDYPSMTIHLSRYDLGAPFGYSDILMHDLMTRRL